MIPLGNHLKPNHCSIYNVSFLESQANKRNICSWEPAICFGNYQNFDRPVSSQSAYRSTLSQESRPNTSQIITQHTNQSTQKKFLIQTPFAPACKRGFQKNTPSFNLTLLDTRKVPYTISHTPTKPKKIGLRKHRKLTLNSKIAKPIISTRRETNNSFWLEHPVTKSEIKNRSRFYEKDNLLEKQQKRFTNAKLKMKKKNDLSLSIMNLTVNFPENNDNSVIDWFPKRPIMKAWQLYALSISPSCKTPVNKPQIEKNIKICCKSMKKVVKLHQRPNTAQPNKNNNKIGEIKTIPVEIQRSTAKEIKKIPVVKESTVSKKAIKKVILQKVSRIPSIYFSMQAIV